MCLFQALKPYQSIAWHNSSGKALSMHTVPTASAYGYQQPALPYELISSSPERPPKNPRYRSA